MIHWKNRRPFRSQNLGSHGSKGPQAAPNRCTRCPGTWNSDLETRGTVIREHRRWGKAGRSGGCGHSRGVGAVEAGGSSGGGSSV